MKKPLASIEHTSNVRQLNKSIEKLKQMAIYVGIAADSKKDKRRDGGPNNFILGYIHEKGSPAMNIPARPFLVPGVNKAKAKITKGMEAAMQAALHEKTQEVKILLDNVGSDAAKSVQIYMTQANFEPLKPASIRNRHRSRETKSKREGENNMDASSIRPLINSGSLMGAISYNVEEE